MFYAGWNTATIKACLLHEVSNFGYNIILANTFHLMLRPGVDIVSKAHGGIHNFMKWDGAIITDSGGYQVFSLSKLRKITKRVFLILQLMDLKVFLDPKKSIDLQEKFNSDVIMQFDECTPYPADEKTAEIFTRFIFEWGKNQKSAITKKKVIYLE